MNSDVSSAVHQAEGSDRYAPASAYTNTNDHRAEWALYNLT